MTVAKALMGKEAKEGRESFLRPCGNAKLSVTLGWNPAIYLTCVSRLRGGNPFADRQSEIEGIEAYKCLRSAVCLLAIFVLSTQPLHVGGMAAPVETRRQIQWLLSGNRFPALRLEGAQWSCRKHFPTPLKQERRDFMPRF